MADVFAAARDRLVQQLADDALLTDDAWRRAVTAVRRELLFTAFHRDGSDVPAATPEPEVLYDADHALPLAPMTHPHQVAPPPRSCARLLHGLDLDANSRVLVMGAADAYLSALLCHRLGDDHVTAVEPDTRLHHGAQAALAACGYHPRLHHGDIDTVHDVGGPATHLVCASPRPQLSWAWLRMVEPGGVIVAALSAQQHSGPAVRLAVTDTFAYGYFLPGDAPALPPGPHRAQPAEAIGISFSVPGPGGLDLHRLWWPDSDHEICVY